MSSEGPNNLETIGLLAIVVTIAIVIISIARFMERDRWEDLIKKGETAVIGKEFYRCTKAGDL